MFIKFDKIVPDTGNPEEVASKALKLDSSFALETFGANKFMVGSEPYYLTFNKNDGLGEDVIEQNSESYLDKLKNNGEQQLSDVPKNEEVIELSETKKSKSEQKKPDTQVKPKTEKESEQPKKKAGITAKELLGDLFS